MRRLSLLLRAAAHLLCGGIHALVPLPRAVLLVTLALNSLFNEAALAHLWWAGQGHLPPEAMWRLALGYCVPSTLGFFGMEALMAMRGKRQSASSVALPLWSGDRVPFGLWSNLLVPALVAFVAWGTAV